jgi:hypothetical protein
MTSMTACPIRSSPLLRFVRPLLAAAALLAAAVGSFAAASAGGDAQVTTSITPEGGRIVLTAQGVPAPTQVIFSASADTNVQLGAAEVTSDTDLTLRIVQGRPEVLSLGLTGEGDVTDVVGLGLRDWAVRRANGKRFLDIRVSQFADGPVATSFTLHLHAKANNSPLPTGVSVLLLAPGDAIGFSSKVSVQADQAVDANVTSFEGLTPVGNPSDGALLALQYISTGEGHLLVALARRGAAVPDLALGGARLVGRANEAGGSVDFSLQGQLDVKKVGARLRVFSGEAALSEAAAGDGWHVELVTADGGYAYDLVGEKVGSFPLNLPFAAGVRENGDWRLVDFQMPASAAVPLQLDGLGADVEFNATGSVVPVAAGLGWQGFLPADGHALFAWRHQHEADEGTLSFTSTEQTDVQVSAGLVQQTSQIEFSVLQGKLAATGPLRIALAGPGDITGVEGYTVTSFNVVTDDKGARTLEVRLSRPFEGADFLTVTSRTALGGFPIHVEPLRLTPIGGVRHSGFVRVTSRGAVRLEITDVAGMMQLAPEQFTFNSASANGARQVFVYRFPSGEYAYKISADQILPEVGVSQVVTYELGETDRTINADLELDVREAPIRDWSLEIPGDYTVVGVAGNGVADNQPETATQNGRRVLKILFSQAVQGRVLLGLRLEKNQPAAAGDWVLPPLVYPGAKSVRGHVGAVSVPGYRLVPAAAVRQLVEVPLSYFPRTVQGLQQAWRLKDQAWTADLRIEALSQSIQADVFHLYSLKEGMVSGSVLINYFVVGAPATEWRIQVPVTDLNIDVTGQNMRRDWRREGDQVIVTLPQPVLGAATLLLTFDQPTGESGTFSPGEVHPIGVQSERGFVQVVSPLQVRLAENKISGLTRLEAIELPTEYQLLTTLPSLAVYQYSARPFALELGVTRFQPAELVNQVVDYAKLESAVGRDGEASTTAHFFVKTHGNQDLRFTLPPGAALWNVSEGGNRVSVRAAGGKMLVPLTGQSSNPNDPVDVTLVYGQQKGESGTRVDLAMPQLEVPVVVSEWTVHGDTGRLLVARGGTSVPTAPNLTETGFAWLSGQGKSQPIQLLCALLLGALLLRSNVGWRLAVGLAAATVALWFAIALANDAASHRLVNRGVLTFAAMVVPPNGPITISLDNVSVWRAMVSWLGVLVALAGLATLALRCLFADAAGQLGLSAVGAVLLSAGLLAQRGGAIAFFWAVAVAIGLIMVLPGLTRLGRWFRQRSRRAKPSAPRRPGSAGPAATVASLLLAAGLGLLPGSARVARADPLESDRTIQSMAQTWQLHDGRLSAEVDLTIRGVAGESFILLNPPAVLTDFQGPGLRVGKADRDGRTVYFVSPEKDGTFTAHVKFELAVPNRSAPIPLPTGPAAMQTVTVQLDEDGWEFASPQAMRVVPLAGPPVIALTPKRRVLASEKLDFYTETANLYLPAPGVVNGRARVTVRPVQGLVSSLDLVIPAGFTVGDVGSGPVGPWRFNPATNQLHVSIEPAQAGVFHFDVETQLGTGALPVDLTLKPLRVPAAHGEVGTIALGFGGDAQPEALKVQGLSPANSDDFDQTLIPRQRDGRPAAVLEEVYRHGQDGGQVSLTVAPVAPEVRVTSRQVFSLGDDRLVLAVDLNVSITRVGLFKLSFVLPDGLEIESLSGPALSHWVESAEDGKRVITMNLNGRTIGDQTFSLTLTGAAVGAQAGWAVPRILLREATRQTGEVILVPDKGLSFGQPTLDKALPLDLGATANNQPGTLGFRLLQADWALTIPIQAVEPWITVQALQEVTLREGQTLTRLSLRYRVENATVKQVKVQLQGLTDEEKRTVHAAGSAVSDFVGEAGPDGLWDLRFQHGIAGETEVQIEYQGQAVRPSGRETVVTPGFPAANQVIQLVAVRAAGRLEVEANPLPRGWQRADWSGVPPGLLDRGDRSVPALSLKVSEPHEPLVVTVRQNEVADLLKLRVTQGDLATVFTPGGSSLTTVQLRLEVSEKSTLRVRLPPGARLFNTFVNGESVPVVGEAAAFLFYVSPNTNADHSASVRFAYEAPAVPGSTELLGPSLDKVPLENVTWRVALPPGQELKGYSGGFQLDRAASEPGVGGPGGWGISSYRNQVQQDKNARAQDANNLLRQAASYLQRGDQQQAGEVLSRAANAGALDEASNEDARVQLRALRAQQTMLGLNTRRQRLYLDNNGDAPRNAQLEQAANLNPYMQGRQNFDPNQVDQLLMGNTEDENSSLHEIALKIVDQQHDAEPAPGAIDVTMQEHARMLTFDRSLQVEGGAPLTLELKIGPARESSRGYLSLVLLAIAALAMLSLAKRQPV